MLGGPKYGGRPLQELSAEIRAAMLAFWTLGPVAMQSVTEAVLADASKRTGIEAAKLEVLESAWVTWPDGSLGCPQPGLQFRPRDL